MKSVFSSCSSLMGSLPYSQRVRRGCKLRSDFLLETDILQLNCWNQECVSFVSHTTAIPKTQNHFQRRVIKLAF